MNLKIVVIQIHLTLTKYKISNNKKYNKKKVIIKLMKQMKIRNFNHNHKNSCNNKNNPKITKT
jgi:hypothetical protein